MSAPKPCANCGKVGSTTVCGRCGKVAYCSKTCQKTHWKKGGHKHACKPLRAAKATTPVPDSADAAADKNQPECYICLERCTFPLGCACRGNAGFAHPACIEQRAKQESPTWYYQCDTCNQQFTGPMQTDLADRWYDATRNLPKCDGRRIMASSNKADALFAEGKYDDALKLYKKALDSQPSGKKTRGTLHMRINIANVILKKDEYVDAIKQFREIKNDIIELFGADDYEALSVSTLLANALTMSEQYAEAEELLRDVLERQTRIFGKGNSGTLRTAMNMGSAMQMQNKVAGAERLFRETLTVQTQLLGPKHPDTLTTVKNLALLLMQTGRYKEAKPLLTEAHAIDMQLLGPDHPNTQHSIALLDSLPDLQTKGTGRLMDMCC